MQQIKFIILLLFFTLAAKGSFASGQDTSAKIMQGNRLKAQDLLEKGSRAFKNNDIQRAISLLEKSITVDPGYAEAYYRLGVIYIHQGDADKAIAYMVKTVEINPNFTQAYTNLGSILAQLKRYAEAIGFYEKALSLDQNNPKIYYNIGLIYLSIGKNDSAEEYFAKTKELCLLQNNTRLLEELRKVYKD